MIDNTIILSNTTLYISDNEIIRYSDDVLRFIYDSLKGNYTKKCFSIDSLDY